MIRRRSINSFFSRISSSVLLSVLAATAQANGEILLTWHGQGTTEIVSGKQGDTLLIDAFFLQNPAGVSALERANLILLTHGHGDHVGDAPATISAAAPSNVDTGDCQEFPPFGPVVAELSFPLLVANSGLTRNLLAHGFIPVDRECRVVDMNKGGKLIPGRVLQLGTPSLPFREGRLPLEDLGDVEEIVMVPAEHSSELVGPQTQGKFVDGGAAVGYVVRFKSGFTLYHAGDTDVFDEMERIGKQFDIDLALVPTGGNFTMDSQAAAHAVVELIKPRFVIPIHWFGNPAFNGTTGQDLVDDVARLKSKRSTKPKVIVLEVGDTAILRGAGRKASVKLMK